jgi:hypothetical protein
MPCQQNAVQQTATAASLVSYDVLSFACLGNRRGAIDRYSTGGGLETQQRTCSSSRHCFHMHRGYWPAHCPPNRSVLPLNSTRTPRSCRDSSRTVALRALILAQSEACIGKPTFAFTTLLVVYQASYNTPTVVPGSILQHTTVDSICRCCFLPSYRCPRPLPQLKYQSTTPDRAAARLICCPEHGQQRRDVRVAQHLPHTNTTHT